MGGGIGNQTARTEKIVSLLDFHIRFKLCNAIRLIPRTVFIFPSTVSLIHSTYVRDSGLFVVRIIAMLIVCRTMFLLNARASVCFDRFIAEAIHSYVSAGPAKISPIFSG